MKFLRFAIASAVIVTLFSAGAFAQDATELDKLDTRPETPKFEQDVSVTLQLLDIVVTDGEGNYINDLKRDDFTIRVNGNPVSIQTFDVYFRGQRGGIEDLATGSIPDAISPARRIVLFFDQAYSSFYGLRKAKAAAVEFVRRNLSPGDLVMILGYERSIKVYQDFTRDRDELVNAIEKIKFAMVAGNRTNVRFEGENFFNVRQYLTAMDKLALFLNSWRGRKTVVMLSEGFDQRLVYTSLRIYQQDMIEQFNDSNASIYSIDIAGLSVPGEGGGSPTMEANRRRNRHDSLSIFANETGGKFYKGNNNIEQLLLNIDDDISNYYVIGFYTESRRDGNFREVDVSVNRPGLEVKHRKGFFAPKPFDDLSSDERTIQLEAGFHSPVPAKEFPVEYTTHVFPRNDGTAVASVVIDAPLNESGKQDIEMLGYVYDKEENLVDIFHKRFYFNASGSDARFYHVQTVNLESGDNLIKLVVRDNRTGKRNYNFVNARMPLLGEGMHTSTIAFLSDKGSYIDSRQAKVKNMKRDYKDVPQSEPADPLSPLTRAGVRISAADALPRSSAVEFILKVSGISSGLRYQERLKGDFALRGLDGSKIDLPETGWEVMSVPGSEEAIVRAIVDLSQIPRGEYILTATVEDTETEQIVGQRRDIVLE